MLFKENGLISNKDTQIQFNERWKKFIYVVI